VQDGGWESWRDLGYLNPGVKGVNVIGGEACLSSEFSNVDTQDQKIWARASMVG
jgi:hypothetical protein